MSLTTGKIEGRSPKALEGFRAQSQLIQLNFANSLDPSAQLRKSIHLYILNHKFVVILNQNQIIIDRHNR